MGSISEKDKAWLLKEKYQGKTCPKFLADCQRLELGEPLAFVIGHQPFLNSTIHLDSRPLIPRTETEYWVSHFIPEVNINKPNANLKILDLCAGSGCIGVAVAMGVSGAQVDFSEYKESHKTTVEKNLSLNGLDSEKHKIYIGDLFSALPREKTYNYILSNPPYIDKSLGRTETSVKDFEPELALYGGLDGLKIIERIIAEAPIYLEEQGELWLEHEPEQAETIKKLAGERFITHTHKDQYNVNRWSRLVLQ